MSYDEYEEEEDGFRMNDLSASDDDEIPDFGLDEEDPESSYS